MRTFSGNASYNKSKFSFIPPLTKKKLHTILFCVGTEAKGLVVRIAFTTDFYLLKRTAGKIQLLQSTLYAQNSTQQCPQS